MGYVLTALREKYPDLRVYSFDYYAPVEAIQTLHAIYKTRSELPALIINNKPYYGFRTVEELETQVPALKELARLKTLESQATSTDSTQ